jgi:hypothetical protein
MVPQASGVHITSAGGFIMDSTILLDPMEIDFGNYICAIADIINKYHDNHDTEMIEYEDDWREGHKIPLDYEELENYEFPSNERKVEEICKEIAGYLDWFDDDSIIFPEDGYLYVIK